MTSSASSGTSIWGGGPVGLEGFAVGVVLLVATRRAELARGAIYAVLVIEVSRVVVSDLVVIARGTRPSAT